MTGLCKEGWILATLSKENSNQKKYYLLIAMIPIVSKKKASEIHCCGNRDFTALLNVLPNFLQISHYDQCSPLFPTSTLRCFLLLPSCYIICRLPQVLLASLII